MKSLKYARCSFDIDFILSLTKEKFISNYMGTDVFKGARQAEMLADAYDKAMAIRGVAAQPLPEVVEEPEPHDNNTESEEMGEPEL